MKHDKIANHRQVIFFLDSSHCLLKKKKNRATLKTLCACACNH